MNYFGFKTKWYGKATCWHVDINLHQNDIAKAK